MTLKLYWHFKYGDKQSNSLGYAIHNDTMFRYTSALPYVEIDDDAKDAIIVTSADFYDFYLEGKKNWLFTMFEGTRLPNIYAKNIQKADRLIVPCTFCYDLFRPHYKGPIYVCHEGAEPEVFTYKKRKYSKPFRYLWIGAPNPRKGYEETIAAWTYGGFINDPDVELYFKTTKVTPSDEINDPKLAHKFSKIPDYEKRGNIHFDSRKLPIEELVGLYHSAHVLVHPTRGEGWGLVLNEAMSTGLPSIATQWSGTADFFDSSVGLPLKYTIKDNEVRLMIKADQTNTEDLIVGAAHADIKHLISMMQYAYNHYAKVRRLGKAAATRVRESFTWELAAKKLASIVAEDNHG